jgi:hypothetical protein
MIRDARLSSAVSIAPIRSRPKRTYDEVTEEFTPEGDHIPYVLRRHLETAAPDNKYLEKAGIETAVYPLSLDRSGNILGGPPSYREFFLREEMSLLTRKSA